MQWERGVLTSSRGSSESNYKPLLPLFGHFVLNFGCVHCCWRSLIAVREVELGRGREMEYRIHFTVLAFRSRRGALGYVAPSP